MNSLLNLGVMMALCAVTTLMSAKGIAVFNDATRPMVLEYKEKRLTRSALGTSAFAFGIGYILGFIPQSIATGIIIIHVVLLGTDIVGTYIPESKYQTAISLVVGATYGVVMALGIPVIDKIFSILPYNFLPQLGQVSSIILLAFAVFPCLVVSLQYGWGKGIITFSITILAQVVVSQYGKFTLSSGQTIAINANAIALFFGMVAMIFFAVRDKREASNTQATLVSIFAERIKSIKKYWYLFAISGGLIALSAALKLTVESPMSAPLYQSGDFYSAAITELARVIGFIPLVVTTGIATGTYSPAGVKMVFVIGSLAALVGNPFLALIFGAIWMVMEVFLLESFAKMLDKFPGVKDCGDQIRTAITKVLEVALLVGGITAAAAIAPSWGAMFVVGLYVLNNTFKKKIVSLAIGPVGAILVGVIANILVVLNLMNIPV